jgi:hypothetical protein
LYDYSGNILYTNHGNTSIRQATIEDAKEYNEEERNVFILGTISVAIVAIGFIIVSVSE